MIVSCFLFYFFLGWVCGWFQSFKVIFVQAFKKLADSTDKLSKIVSEEVPGTLSSLKLSGFELNELTQQLTNLRYCWYLISKVSLVCSNYF